MTTSDTKEGAKEGGDVAVCRRGNGCVCARVCVCMCVCVCERERERERVTAESAESQNAAHMWWHTCARLHAPEQAVLEDGHLTGLAHEDVPELAHDQRDVPA